MIILEKPFVSGFLKETIIKLSIPVLDNETAKNESFPGPVNLVSEFDFVERIRTQKYPLLYTNSENSINWISRNLGETKLPEDIRQLKDKHVFRELIRQFYPDFYFTFVDVKDLEFFDVSQVSKPFIIKPAIGFVSMGVYTVNSDEEWPEIVRAIRKEIDATRDMYPPEVINTEKWLIEEWIDGDEFAVDAYFDEHGEAVVLNIMKHLFASEDDVDDKVYIMSSEIMRSFNQPFAGALTKLGKILDLRRFPIHVEFRVSKKYGVIPIEANPMRFAGWCTTDVTRHAYGINIYDYYLNQKKPDWDILLSERDGKTYSINVAAVNSIGNRTIEFDYDLLANQFSKPLEIRKTDVNKYGLAGFLFAETNDPEIKELYRYLKTDVNQFARNSIASE